VTGIIAFSNVLRWLLNHYHDLTVAALMGFMIGSLREVWPWKETQLVGDVPTQVVPVLPGALDGEVLLALGLMLLGFVAVMTLEYLAEGRHKPVKQPTLE